MWFQLYTSSFTRLLLWPRLAIPIWANGPMLFSNLSPYQIGRKFGELFLKYHGVWQRERLFTKSFYFGIEPQTFYMPSIQRDFMDVLEMRHRSRPSLSCPLIKPFLGFCPDSFTKPIKCDHTLKPHALFVGPPLSGCPQTCKEAGGLYSISGKKSNSLLLVISFLSQTLI